VRTVLITGGNTGIGKETALALAARGDDVVIACRNVEKGKSAARDIKEKTGRDVAVMKLNLASTASIRVFATTFLEEHPRLDVLVLNAGLFVSQRSTTEDGFETMFGVNHLGHFLLTRLLEDRLVASAPSRVVVVASDAHRRPKKGLDFDDLMSARTFQPFDVYGKSKLANVYFARELSRRLAARGVTANSLHPGVVATEFAGADDAKGLVHFFFTYAKWFLKTPAEGARTSIFLASDPSVADKTGLYFQNEKPARPTRIAQDDALAAKLWTVSESLLGLRS